MSYGAVFDLEKRVEARLRRPLTVTGGWGNSLPRQRRQRTQVSGFTFVRNGIDLDYPFIESIRSILPLCDECVVAAGDSTDGTTDLLRAIGSRKLRIIETRWDPALFVNGAIFSQQTNIALQACRGQWAFYLQADEVIHERFLPVIEDSMRRYLEDRKVEGLLFDYLHFFGDYGHVQTSHNWYGHEVRIVRTGIGVQSWHDAQGFRRHGKKLRVARSGACVFHYGWVGSPDRLQRKRAAAAAAYRAGPDVEPSDGNGRRGAYGRLWGLAQFGGTHPAVMRERVDGQNWTVRRSSPVGHKHDRMSMQLLSLVENRVLGRRVGERRNYVLARGGGSGTSELVWRRWVGKG